ncbi:hypothetical protein ACEQ8H_001183 [Pleosporales sp. CAS-2024a]
MASRLFCFFRKRNGESSTGSCCDQDIPVTSQSRRQASTSSSTAASTLPDEKPDEARRDGSSRSQTSKKSKTKPNKENKMQKKEKHILILDLGDVLFHYPIDQITAVPPQTFKAIIKSPPWGELECGLLSEPLAIQRISQTLSLDTATIRAALTQCRSLLRVDDALFSQLVALKHEAQGALQVVAMTNISRADFARLKALLPASKWTALFDAEYTSFAAHSIKPHAAYYRHVVRDLGRRLKKNNPHHLLPHLLFVDDKPVNVDAARALGIQAIVFHSPDVLLAQLRQRFLGATAVDKAV